MPDMFDLKGRVALVTGAGGGLGRSFSEALAARGAHVVCADVDADAAGATAARIMAAGGEATATRVDVAEADSVEAMARFVRESGRGLDVLINNAGVASIPGRLLDVPIAEWDRVVAINLRGPFLCARALLPVLLEGEAGSIINVSSFLGLVGTYPGFPITSMPYSASKAGVVGFTRQLAMEYAREGLRVNAIAPGWHGGTDLGRARRAVATNAETARFEDYLKVSIPMGHRARPEDLSGLVVYLASDASSYVTGQIFAHDGGLTAG